MKSTWFALSAFLLFVFFTACGPKSREIIDEEQFGAYWYQGKAEINVFDLKQSRYGEEREGKVVMIFVTEDFSRRKQVKLDDPESAGGDARKVLKLNMTREFETGIYPYHTMLSVFTPVQDDVPAFKISHSVSEWCGQTFAQLNWKNAAYQAKLFSYFESEGDQELKVDASSEDEIFNLIRLNPELVPQGNIRLIPSLTFQRFAHISFKAYRAEISLEELGQQTNQFVIEYPELNRTVKIQFIKTFPFEIVSWEEIRISPSGREERSLAIRKEKMLIDYWTKNGVEDEWLRKQLGL